LLAVIVLLLWKQGVAASEDVKIVLDDKVKELEKALKDTIAGFEKKVSVLEQENQYLQEKLRLALFGRFGRHAEKFTGEGQLPLFDAEEGAAPKACEQPEEQEPVKSYNRTKRGRKPIDEHIPRIDEIIDIPAEEGNVLKSLCQT
jgi:hypothetical protein